MTIHGAHRYFIRHHRLFYRRRGVPKIIDQVARPCGNQPLPFAVQVTIKWQSRSTRVLVGLLDYRRSSGPSTGIVIAWLGMVMMHVPDLYVEVIPEMQSGALL